MTPAMEAALKRAADRIDQPGCIRSGEQFTPGTVHARRTYIILEELGLDRYMSVLSLRPGSDHEQGVSYTGAGSTDATRRQEPQTATKGQSAAERLARLDQLAWPATPEAILGSFRLMFHMGPNDCGRWAMEPREGEPE